MTIEEAIKSRHSVRKYINRQIPKEIVNKLIDRIYQSNDKYNLNMKLIVENTDAFSPIIKLILAKGVRNYIVLAGKSTFDVDEKLGYCGIDVALFAQILGLNSWWVGSTFNKKKVSQIVNISQEIKITGIIAIGYGANQGLQHKLKSVEDISSYNCKTVPEWFIKGVNMVLFAPSALNKQAFAIRGDKNTVSISCNNGIFSGTDLGIAKYHFEIGAGKNNFKWI